MKKYIKCTITKPDLYFRIGKLPKGGRSVNWLALSNAEKDALPSNPELVYEYVPEYALEDGISVFEMDDNGFPVINTFRLISTLSTLIFDDNYYEVVGVPSGKGNDGEPVLNDCVVIKESKLKPTDLQKHIISELNTYFNSVDGVLDLSDRSPILKHFDMDNNMFVSYCGLTYSQPKAGKDFTSGLDLERHNKRKSDYYYRKALAYKDKIVELESEIQYLENNPEDALLDYLDNNYSSYEPYITKSGKQAYKIEVDSKTKVILESQLERYVEDYINNLRYQVIDLRKFVKKYS